MGTCSYVLTGTQLGMQESFGSTCHGAGRAQSRNKSRRNLSYEEVLGKLAEQGIAIRVASPKLVMEEAPESYKDVTEVDFFPCHHPVSSSHIISLHIMIPYHPIPGREYMSRCGNIEKSYQAAANSSGEGITALRCEGHLHVEQRSRQPLIELELLYVHIKIKSHGKLIVCIF